MVLHVLSASKSAPVPLLKVSRELCDLHVCGLIRLAERYQSLIHILYVWTCAFFKKIALVLPVLNATTFEGV